MFWQDLELEHKQYLLRLCIWLFHDKFRVVDLRKIDAVETHFVDCQRNRSR